MWTVYVLKSCDTCRKASKWLVDNAIEAEFRDIRSDGLTEAAITHIVSSVGSEKAVNRRSTMWRGLDESQKAGLNDASAISLIEDNPTLLKRPVFVAGDTVLTGFDDEVRSTLSAD